MTDKIQREFVKDYPRPPLLVESTESIQVIALGKTIIHATHSIRMLETYHPPTYYFKPESVNQNYLTKSSRQSYCEWKGIASYFNIKVGNKTINNVAWSYKDPCQSYKKIAGWYAVYPQLMDSCWVNNEKVDAQVGDFYGGWITSRIVGPFKGDPEHPQLI